MDKKIPLIRREALCPTERMNYFSSGSIKHVCDVFNAICRGT